MTDDRRRVTIPLAVSLLPALLGLGAWWLPAAPTLSLAANPLPALSFRQYAVDLGQVRPTTEVMGSFVFENRGETSVTIQNVEPSCHCLKPRLEQKVYAPGEFGRIDLRIQPASESPGQKEYFAVVKYTDPEPREVRLTFRAVLPDQQLSVKPAAMMFYQFSDQPTTQPLIVQDTRGRAIGIRSIKVASPLVTTELGEPHVSEEGVALQKIHVTVSGECPPTQQQILLTIETDDPETPLLRVPLLVQGRAVADRPK